MSLSRLFRRPAPALSQFLIYCHARTGSTHLVKLLNSLPSITCHGELFTDKRFNMSRWHKERMTRSTVEERDADPAAFLAELRVLNARTHFGFKAFPSHIRDRPALHHILKDADWKLIFLYRDPLAVYASLELAKVTDVWMKLAGDGDTAVKPSRLAFDPAAYDRFIAGYEVFLNFIGDAYRKAPDRRCLIAYEDLTEGALGLHPVLRTIGCDDDPTRARSPTMKQSHAADPLDVFAEPAFVAKHVRNDARTVRLQELVTTRLGTR